MGSLDEIRNLWKAHLAAPFPPAVRGLEIEGIDLVLEDSYTAGCIDTFLGNVDVGTGPTLDQRRRECLEQSVIDLRTVVQALDGDAKTRYERLLALSELVLAEIQKFEKK